MRLINAILLVLVQSAGFAAAFQPSVPATARINNPSPLRHTVCELARDPNTPYSQEVYLREEAESPFRKVRFFFYYSLGGGALTSFAVSMARVAAALSGINTDLLEESAINAGVDLAGIIAVAFFLRNDLQAQESRLKRASKGAELAKLLVRGSKAIIGDVESVETNNRSDSFTTSLASLRRGRGIEKRVVIAVAGAEKIASTLEEADRLQEALIENDLLIVPVVLPSYLAPESELAASLDCVAVPLGSNWRGIIQDEVDEAKQQGVDAAKEGFCVILKKNGRVGQRTRGIFLNNMVGDVEQRLALGMDVKNI